MIEMKPPFRRARPGDARAMAELADHASYGLASYFWDRIKKPGETPLDVGIDRAGREDCSFSYHNALVAEADGQCAACLIGYAQPETPEAIDYDAMPPILIPLQELENLAPGTWYVNVLAAYPDHRGKGYGTGLLELAGQLAQASECPALSLIAEDDNLDAIRLYQRFGFREVARRPIVTEGWTTKGESWLLMTKPLASG